MKEELSLLKDFAYNVDPSSRLVHAHRFQTEYPEKQKESLERSLFVKKVEELAGRLKGKLK